MRRCLHIALILCLAVTAIGLGVARGTVAMGGQVVLCTGQGVVVVSHPDAPHGAAVHICPDMALSLLAAVAAWPVAPARAVSITELTVTYAAPVVRGLQVLSPSARDPPSAART